MFVLLCRGRDKAPEAKGSRSVCRELHVQPRVSKVSLGCVSVSLFDAVFDNGVGWEVLE